jgi:nucleoside-diphosphate-sugar epimerase
MGVLVTGGSGRVGASVVAELARSGQDVLVFDQHPPRSVAGTAFTSGDVTDLGQVVGACALASAQAIVHLAAIPIAGRTTDDVLFRTNVLGTFNIYEAAFRLGVARVILVSSDAVYGWPLCSPGLLPQYLPIDEGHPVHPQHPWSLSKLVGEQIAASYAERGGPESVVLRPPRVLDEAGCAALRASGGAPVRRQFEPFGWVSAADLAVAVGLAVHTPGLTQETLLVCADDSCVGEPLADLLPRLDPRTRALSAALSGTQSALSNERAREVLGWRPRSAWRA